MNKPTLLSLAIFAGFVGSNTAYATALNVQDQTADITFSAATSIQVSLTPMSTSLSGLQHAGTVFTKVKASTADGSDMWMAAQFSDNANQVTPNDYQIYQVFKGSVNPANTIKLVFDSSGKAGNNFGVGANAWRPYDRSVPHSSAEWSLGTTADQTVQPDSYNVGVRVASYTN